jgi:hypothetical protein
LDGPSESEEAFTVLFLGKSAQSLLDYLVLFHQEVIQAKTYVRHNP